MADITVIMPVYNGEIFVENAITSVALQDMSLELIIIDDCSQDKSLEIIEKTQKKFDNINFDIVKLEKNSGVAFCRNLAIKRAKTKYIAFLDCDDIWEKGKLKKQIELMEKTNCPVCCTAREFIDLSGNSLGKIVNVSEEISYKDLLKHNSISLSSAMIKTEIAKEFPMTSGDFHEDYIFWLAVLKKHGNAKGIDKPFLKYRINENSKSGNKVKSAKMHYKSLLKHGINPLKAIYLFAHYAVHGVLNHSAFGTFIAFKL